MKKEVICGVYKIINIISGDTYIGSSVDIYRRWALHKTPSQHKMQPNNKLYKDMDKIGTENFKLEIICKTDKNNLKQEEQETIELYKPTYNYNRAHGLDVENHKKLMYKWRTTHKERHNEFSKRYSQTHKNHVKNYQYQYNNQLCCFNSEILTFVALSSRFRRKGIKKTIEEAKKYLIKN